MKGTVLTILMTLSWPMASAAPWVQSDGDFYTRIAIASEEIEGLQAYRGDIYGEYGLTDRWTLTGKVEAIAYEDADDFNAQGWRATLRRNVFKRGAFIGSVEFGALQGAAIGGSNGCETLGAEMRGGMAWSGKVRKIDTFVFAEVVGRLHEDCRRERFEFGLGQRMTKNIWTISQVWIERGTQNAESDKLQSELLWKGESYDLSIGYRQENGRQFDEQGIFVALAKRF